MAPANPEKLAPSENANSFVVTRLTPIEAAARSEEHTSELQSQSNLVCRLLLESDADRRDLHSFPTRRSSDLAEATQDDHAEHEDRDREVELLRRDHLQVARPDGSGEPGEARAEREREQLRRHEIDAHRGGREIGRAHV